MRTVQVRAGRPYEVHIGRGLMDAAGGMIVEALGGTRMAAILTDDTVDALYGAKVERALSESGFRACRFAMPHGEAHKTLATWEKMLAFLSEQGMTRADVYRAAKLNPTFVYDMFQGKCLPKRDNAIMLAFGLRCNLRETQRLLRLAGVSELWPKNRRDAIILWCVEQGRNLDE